MPENHGKQNQKESYTNEYKKDIAGSYGYKLVSVDDKFNKLYKIYLGTNAVYKFPNSKIEERKYCSNKMKKYFNKELAMTKEDSEDFKNSNKIRCVT